MAARKDEEAGQSALAARLPSDFSLDALRQVLAARLDFDGLSMPLEAELPGTLDRTPPDGVLSDAAVLIPIVNRPDGLSVILTRRPDYLKRHAGQVAFPGGRIDKGDAGPVEAALREAEEEIGLSPSLVEVKGVLEPFATGTGFRIFPVVGIVDPRFTPRINEGEVAEAFEVPFAFLMDPANHLQKTGEFRGAVRSYYEMPFENRRIWGATAHMIVKLYRRLFSA